MIWAFIVGGIWSLLVLLLGWALGQAGRNNTKAED